jgi:signal transduction histidine kinase
MAALPIRLDPGDLPALASSWAWTPLRVGLASAWLAALVALGAVGLGGWSLIDLAQRRIRFVAAVTHELRTPLTTLRLYLDMLTGGMVKGEDQKEEYLRTLNTEADRLNRLVANVLDFSRLENQQPAVMKAPVAVGNILEHVQTVWQPRCRSSEKQLVLDSAVSYDSSLYTDSRVVQQILGNLIDNACKYSKEASDRRVWLHISKDDRYLFFDVEDAGPGVPVGERRAIFRPFRRGYAADPGSGGVGLGLALAQRWSRLLGGRLAYRAGQNGTGACFRLVLPVSS